VSGVAERIASDPQLRATLLIASASARSAAELATPVSLIPFAAET
jgi:hypothetical protein